MPVKPTTLVLTMGAPGVGKTKATDRLLSLLKGNWSRVNKDTIADKYTPERETPKYHKVRPRVYAEFYGEIAKKLKKGNVIIENPHIELSDPKALEGFALMCKYIGIKLKIILFETTEEGLRKNLIRRGIEKKYKQKRDKWKLDNWESFKAKYVTPFQQDWLRKHPLVHFIRIPELQDYEDRGAWVERHNWKPALKHIRS